MPEFLQWAVVVLLWVAVVVAFWERMTRTPEKTPRLPEKAVRHQQEALRAEIGTWEWMDSEQTILWRDWGLLDKEMISAMAGERGWYYRGQNMRAEGCPLFFTRAESAAGILEAEQARKQRLFRTGRYGS